MPIINKYLLKTKEQYPVLHPTLEGKAFYKSANYSDKKRIQKAIQEHVL